VREYAHEIISPVPVSDRAEKRTAQMTQLPKLKRFFTIDEAAQRLSSSCDSPITSQDIFHLVSEGKLRLAAYFLRQPAKEAAPVTRLWNWYPDLPDDPTRLPSLERSSLTGRLEFSTKIQRPSNSFAIEWQSDEILLLDGYYFLWLQGPLYLDYVRRLAAGRDANAFDMVSLDGTCVHAADGTLLQPVEALRGKPASWYPTSITPDPCDMRILATDLLALESDALSQHAESIAIETRLHGRERQHYLKVIAGLLAVARVNKQEAVTEILKLLETSGGQSKIDRATLATTLRDAASYRS
jgi:hypothetical protein